MSKVGTQEVLSGKGKLENTFFSLQYLEMIKPYRTDLIFNFYYFYVSNILVTDAIILVYFLVRTIIHSQKM